MEDALGEEGEAVDDGEGGHRAELAAAGLEVANHRLKIWTHVRINYRVNFKNALIIFNGHTLTTFLSISMKMSAPTATKKTAPNRAKRVV